MFRLPVPPGRVLLVASAPLAGAVFFGSIFVASASLAFWWVESGEVGNAFTYGGRDFTAYPMSVYGGWFRALFAYGLGFGFVAYHPALALLGRADPLGLPAWVGWASPLVALVAAGLVSLRDLSVVEPDIEDVVARLYTAPPR